MISITKRSPGTNDLVLIRDYKVNSGLYESEARVSKTKTLDGGVVINHGGVVEVDRALNVVAALKEADVVTLKDIYETQTFVSVAFKDGVFDAAISTLTEEYGNIQMTIELHEKLSA